jgi:hypothetical protein
MGSRGKYRGQASECPAKHRERPKNRNQLFSIPEQEKHRKNRSELLIRPLATNKVAQTANPAPSPWQDAAIRGHFRPNHAKSGKQCQGREGRRGRRAQPDGLRSTKARAPLSEQNIVAGVGARQGAASARAPLTAYCWRSRRPLNCSMTRSSHGRLSQS